MNRNENKDKFVSSLFQGKNIVSPSGPLIQDLNSDSTSSNDTNNSSSKLPTNANPNSQETAAIPVAVPIPEEPEEKSMLELMMEAHSVAKTEKEVTKSKEAEKTTKEIGGGFKKGFFSSGKKATNKSKHTATTGKNTATTGKNASDGDGDGGLIHVNKPGVNTNITNNNNSGQKESKLVMKEVQQAMSDDVNPMLKQLQQGGVCCVCFLCNYVRYMCFYYVHMYVFVFECRLG